MLIIERLAVGYKVRAKAAGWGPNQPSVTARTIQEAGLAAEHYFGGGSHAGKRRGCPFCQQIAARARKAKP